MRKRPTPRFLGGHPANIGWTPELYEYSTEELLKTRDYYVNNAKNTKSKSQYSWNTRCAHSVNAQIIHRETDKELSFTYAEREISETLNQEGKYYIYDYFIPQSGDLKRNQIISFYIPRDDLFVDVRGDGSSSESDLSARTVYFHLRKKKYLIAHSANINDFEGMLEELLTGNRKRFERKKKFDKISEKFYEIKNGIGTFFMFLFKATVFISFLVLIVSALYLLANGEFSDFTPSDSSNGPDLNYGSAEDNNDVFANVNSPETYRTSPKIVTFKWAFKRSTWTWNYTLYKGVYDYQSGLNMRYYHESYQNPTQYEVDQAIYLRKLSDPVQQETINDIVSSFQEDAQKEGWGTDGAARAMIAFVQNIPYDDYSYENNLETNSLPYQVLYDDTGVCGEKSLLLAALLKRAGYGVALLKFDPENHMAVGVKCPLEYDYKDTGYCFVESTSPHIITDGYGEYKGVDGPLTSTPIVHVISNGLELTTVKQDYLDALAYHQLENTHSQDDPSYRRWIALRNKYDLEETSCEDGRLLCNGECWLPCPSRWDRWSCTYTGGMCVH